MRQLTPSTNLVLAVLAGLGLMGTLTLPWFAAPEESPNPTDGPVERVAWQIGHVFATSARGMVDGNDALGGSRMVLFGVVIVIALLGLTVAANVARAGAEDLLRTAAIAVPVAVVALAIAHPGTDAPLRLHYGFVVAFAVALFTANAAWHGASWRQKHAAPARPNYGR